MGIGLQINSGSCKVPIIVILIIYNNPAWALSGYRYITIWGVYEFSYERGLLRQYWRETRFEFAKYFMQTLFSLEKTRSD